MALLFNQHSLEVYYLASITVISFSMINHLMNAACYRLTFHLFLFACFCMSMTFLQNTYNLICPVYICTIQHTLDQRTGLLHELNVGNNILQFKRITLSLISLNLTLSNKTIVRQLCLNITKKGNETISCDSTKTALGISTSMPHLPCIRHQEQCRSYRSLLHMDGEEALWPRNYKQKFMPSMCLI